MARKEPDCSYYGFCSVEGRTDIGCRRTVNEDSISREDNGKSSGLEVTPNGGAVVVCDGMGGYAGGKVASETAVDAILQHLRGTKYDDPGDAVRNAIIAANAAVLRKAAERPELTGMGCTCVLLLVSPEGEVFVGHIGDSRLYIIRPRESENGRSPIIFKTKDESYVQLLVDQNVITEREALIHPRSNEITNAVGMKNMTPPVVKESIVPEAGDCFLLCSDGLHKVVPEEEIFRIVCNRSLSLAGRVEMLIETARKYGGPDNISAQVVEFSATPKDVLAVRKKKRTLKYFAFSVGALIVAAILGMSLVRNCKEDAPATVTPQQDSDSVKTVQVTNDTTRQESALATFDLGSGTENEASAKSSSGKSRGGEQKQKQEDKDSGANIQSGKNNDRDVTSSGESNSVAKVSNETEVPEKTEKKVKYETEYLFDTKSMPSLVIEAGVYKLADPELDKNDFRSGSVKVSRKDSKTYIINVIGQVDNWKDYKITFRKYKVGQEEKDLPKPIVVTFK